MHFPTFAAVSLCLLASSALACSNGYRYCYQNLPAKDRGEPVNCAINTFVRHMRAKDGGKYINMNEHYYIYKCDKAGVLEIDSICYSCMGTYFRDDKCLDKKRAKPEVVDDLDAQARRNIEWFAQLHMHKDRYEEDDVKTLRWSGRKMHVDDEAETHAGDVKHGKNEGPASHMSDDD